MGNFRPFRFGTGAGGVDVASRDEWIDYVCKVEALGYASLVIRDHIGFGGLAPLPALMAAADTTVNLRLATHVLTNDVRNPVVLTQEAATLDLLSDGRLELGIGAGWLAQDYTVTGIPFDAPRIRVRRLVEAVQLFKRLCREDAVTFQGTYYTVQDMTLRTKPRQRPHPPLYIGGGGKRVLELAAREADIVGLDFKGTQAGQKDVATISAAATTEKLEWVRQAAGDRFSNIELHLLACKVVVTDHRRRGLEEVAAWLAGFPPSMAVNTAMSADAILQSPHLLVGSVEQIIADLQERRERFGISYITVAAEAMEAFSPVVTRLAGT